MSLRFQPCQPCCSCIYFNDDFNRTLDTLSTDKVNIVGSTRYQFPSGEWLVNIPSGQLWNQFTDSEIIFHSGIVNKFDVAVDVILPTSSSYVSILHGDYTFTLQGLNPTGVRATLGDYSIDGIITGYPLNTSIVTRLFDKNDYIGTGSGECLYKYPTSILEFGVTNIEGMNNGGCHLINIDGSGTFDRYGLKATSGVVFDNLLVTFASSGCHDAPARVCKTLCWPSAIPQSLSITFAGFPTTTVPCINTSVSGYTNCVDEGFDEYTNCINEGILDPCDCEAALGLQNCDCYSDNVTCKIGCPTDNFNSTFILDLLPTTPNLCQPCTYKYIGEYDVFYEAADGINGPVGNGDVCNEIMVSGATYELTLNLTVGGYFDCITKDIGIQLNLDTPFLSPIGYSGIPISSSFCIGGSFPTDPNTIVVASGDLLPIGYIDSSGNSGSCNGGGKWYGVCGFPESFCPSTEQERVCSDAGLIQITIGDIIS